MLCARALAKISLNGQPNIYPDLDEIECPQVAWTKFANIYQHEMSALYGYATGRGQGAALGNIGPDYLKFISITGMNAVPFDKGRSNL